MSKLRAIRFMLIGFILAMGLPSFAQLNPKWRTGASDFLDLYQQTNTTKLKPEIVSIFDFSTSMDRIMFHSKFINNFADEEGNATVAKRYYSIKVDLDGNGTTMPYKVTLSLIASDGSGDPVGDNLAINTVISASTTGDLIRPNGDVVTATLVNNPTWTASDPTTKMPGYTNNAADVRNWVRAASHARFTFKNKAGKTWLPTGVTRTVDLPLHWCVLDPSNTSTTDVPLKSWKMTDPKVPANSYEFDSSYLDENASGAIRYLKNFSATNQTVEVWNGSGTWRWSYIQWLLTAKDANGKWIIGDAASTSGNVGNALIKGFANTLPNVSRVQALKIAAIKTWFNYQDKVFWAFRSLAGGGGDDTVGAATNCTTYVSNADVLTTNTPNGDALYTNNHSWKLFGAKDNHAGARYLAKLTTGGNGTPLTRSLADTLGQLQQTSPWDNIETGDDLPQDCMKHFLLVFTDGSPTTDGTIQESSQPYATSAALGNKAVLASPSYMNAHNAYWNLPTLAGVAAHLGDITLNPNMTSAPHTTATTTLSNYLPFFITKRGTKVWSSTTPTRPPHPIQTMAIGISLGLNPTNPNDTGVPKFRLQGAAAAGDPRRTTWDISKAVPFDPYATTQDPNAVYYFDGTDPQRLVDGLDRAFKEIGGMGGTNAASAPVFPTIGAGLGAQVYVGKFLPPDPAGSVWSGDLMMFPTRLVNDMTQIIDNAGNELTNLSGGYQWSALQALKARGWSGRRILTRVPASSTTMHPPITVLNVSGTSPQTDPGFVAIKPFLPAGTDTLRVNYLRNMIGASVADLSVLDANPATRSNIMGDIIGSVPSVLEYSTLPASVASFSSTLATAWNAANVNTRHFRVIFVGSNQGFLHAFGEVSWSEGTVDNANAEKVTVTKGSVDELWAFIPTDILPYVDQLNSSYTPLQPHRFVVDGSPTAYLLDLPQTAAQATGNGRYDIASSNERAMVIFGLGKGGRSYYALDIRDPMTPRFQENSGKGWSLCPDEVDNYPAARFARGGTQSDTITKMGLSSCVPTIARVQTDSLGVVGQLVDVVLLGGGYSAYDTEANLPVKPATNPGTGPFKGDKLGRSVVAVNTQNGRILGVWSLASNTSTDVGPVAAGVVPHEFVVGSGVNHRAYFTDSFGGLWALGSAATNTKTNYNGFRLDSYKIDDWASTPRPVYKEAAPNGLISTLPVPFNIANYPVFRTTVPMVAPATVGIALVTGDRMNPLDSYPTDNPIKHPTQHRLAVVFDRQDSKALGLDTNGIQPAQMGVAGAMVTNSADPDYYLKTKFGYYINFPAGSATGFVPKGITSPLVLNGTLFYSYFTPLEANPCLGGSGETSTFRESNVMEPTGSTIDAPAATQGHSQTSGRVLKWTGVASAISVQSPLSAVQVGLTSGGGVVNDPNATQNLKAQNLDTQSSDRYIKVRVWRTVH